MHLTDPDVRVEDLHVHCGAVIIHRVGPIPVEKVAVGLGHPEPVLGQAQHHAVVDHAAVVVAGELVAAATDSHLRNIASEDLVEKTLGIGADDLDREFAGVAKNDLGSHLPIHLLVGDISELRGD